MLDKLSSAGMVPYISESNIECVVLVLTLVFLITESFFVAFDAIVNFFGLGG